jgi:predicted HD phosphohydrolase
MVIMITWGTEDHDKVGAYYLRSKDFPEKICKLVQNHVFAKKYFCTKDSEYFNKLSDASKMTFKYQGDFMTAEEMKAFEEDPLKELYIKFRNWEELAKHSPDVVTSLDKYKKMCMNILGDVTYYQ